MKLLVLFLGLSLFQPVVADSDVKRLEVSIPSNGQLQFDYYFSKKSFLRKLRKRNINFKEYGKIELSKKKVSFIVSYLNIVNKVQNHVEGQFISMLPNGHPLFSWDRDFELLYLTWNLPKMYFDPLLYADPSEIEGWTGFGLKLHTKRYWIFPQSVTDRLLTKAGVIAAFSKLKGTKVVSFQIPSDSTPVIHLNLFGPERTDMLGGLVSLFHIKKLVDYLQDSDRDRLILFPNN